MSSKPKKSPQYRQKRLDSLLVAQDELMKDLTSVNKAINRIINEVIEKSKGGQL